MHYLCFICMTNQAPLSLLTAAQRQILEALLYPDVDLTLIRSIDLWRCEDCGKLIEVVQGFRKTCLVGAKFLLRSVPKTVKANTTSSKLISTASSVLSNQNEQDVAMSSNRAVCKLRPLFRTSTGLSVAAVLSYDQRPTNPTIQNDDPLHIEVKTESQENSVLRFWSYSDSKPPSVEKSEVKEKPPDESPVENKLLVTEELDIKLEPASDSDTHEAEARDSDSTDTCEADDESQVPMAPVKKVIVKVQPGPVKKTTSKPVITIKKSNIVAPTSLQYSKAMSVTSNLKKPDVQKETTNAVDMKSTKKVQGTPWYIRVLSAEELSRTREEARKDPKFAEAKFKCESCIKVFDCQRAADIHAELHRPPQCRVRRRCDHRYEEPRAHPGKATRGRTNFVKTLFKKPKSKEPKPFKCGVCWAYFRTETALNQHKERKHKEPEELKTCDVCNKVFEGKYKYRQHYKVYHKIPQSRTIDDLRPELFCAKCNIQFNAPSQYNVHMMSLKHTSRDKWQFICDSCDRRFPTKYQLKKHRNCVHLKQNKHQCPKCPKFYSTATRLRRHVEVTHEGRPKLRPHVCHVCGAMFTIKKSLSEHLYKHEGVRPHRCALCPATFTFSAALYTHNKLKHLRAKQNAKKKDKDRQSC